MTDFQPCREALPGYRDLFGKHKNRDDLLSLVRQYPIQQWFCFLCRLQTLLLPLHGDDDKSDKIIFDGLPTDDIKGRFAEYISGTRAPNSPRRLRIFCEAQVSTLQELVLRYAPEASSSRIETEGDYGTLCKALFITWDLMHPGERFKPTDDLHAHMLQLHARQSAEPPQVTCTRTFYAYCMHENSQPACVGELASLFVRATGVKLEDYLTGGLAFTMREQGKSPQNIAQGWFGLGNPDNLENTAESDAIRKFSKVRSGTIEEVRDQVKEWDEWRSISDFSMIPLNRYPLIELPGHGQFVTSLSALSNSLFEGVYHAILSAIVDKHIPDVDVRYLNGLWGELFERYILDLLEIGFGKDRMIRLPSDQSVGSKRADALIIYSDKILIVEIKSSPGKGQDNRSKLPVDERVKRLRDMGIAKAASQIASTIKDLESGKPPLNDMVKYNWSTTTLVPVIITFRPLPLYPDLWSLFEELTAPLDTHSVSSSVLKPRFLSVADIECIPDMIGEGYNIGNELTAWATDPDFYSSCLFDYHRHQCRVWPDQFRKKRYRCSLQFIAKRLGLDPTRIGAEEEGS